MKNIYKLLIALVVLVGSTELTKAQGTYQTPWPGSTFTYSFGDMVSTNTTKWYVSTEANVNATPVGTPADHFVISAIDNPGASVGADGVLTGQGVSKVNINWAGTATGTYYVYLKVFDGNETACFNVKGFKVDVVSGAFNVFALNVTGGTILDADKRGEVVDGNIVATDCPNESTISPIFGSGYSLGTTEVVYKVKRELSMNDWHLKFGVSEGTVKYVYGEDNNEITQTATNEYDVTAVNSYVLVYVTVPNVEASAQTVIFTIDATNSKDLITSTTDLSSSPLNDPVDNVGTYIIKSIPTIGNMVDLN